MARSGDRASQQLKAGFMEYAITQAWASRQIQKEGIGVSKDRYFSAHSICMALTKEKTVDKETFDKRATEAMTGSYELRGVAAAIILLAEVIRDLDQIKIASAMDINVKQ